MGPRPCPNRSDAPAPQARLEALAEMVDEAGPPDGHGHVLVHVVDRGHDLDLGTKVLDPGIHPFQALAGFTAPDDWWAVGVRATGRAHHLDRPRRTPTRSRVTVLVARTGEEASVVHIGGRRLPDAGCATGVVADVCRRVVGRPTDAAPRDPAALWTVLWLDRLMTAWNRPAERRDLLRSWSAIARQHPACDDDPDAAVDVIAAGRALAARWSWADLRAGAVSVPLPDGPLAPEVAAWMDDGFYARWTVGAFPAITTLASDLHGLLGELHGTRLAQAVLTLLR